MLNRYPIMFCFVGEQPIANLIPIKHLNPENVILCVTNRTKEKGNLLRDIIKGENSIETIEPYNINEISKQLTDLVDDKKQKVASEYASKIVFNLTGGTKPMAFAGLLTCQKNSSPFCYLQSEGGKSILYTYRWENNEPVLSERSILPDIIELEEYVKIHVGNFVKESMNKYEKLVWDCLKGEVDEIMHNVRLTDSLEIDLILRVGNKVGIVEIKTGKNALKKRGIDQLNTAGGREYLGSYTKKFYITDREYTGNYMANKDLAEERNITVIELKNSVNTVQLHALDEDDKELLIKTVTDEMKR